MGLLLLIDDDPGIRYSFQRAFGNQYEVLAEASGPEGLAALDAHSDEVDLVLLDIRMPGLDGFAVLEEARRVHPNVPVVMVTAYSDTETAIQAMRRGAYDYLVKPFETGRVRDLVDAARKQRALTRTSVALGAETNAGDRSPSDRLVGGSPPMLDVYKKVGQVAATDLPCLITGPTGSGKELVARAVVHHGSRADQAFLVVDCASIPHDLLEAELFGYEEGAFTGARRGGKIGKFELCQRGTLFLDEIGDLHLDLQAKFLRALQTNTIQRVGGVEDIPVDVRVLAATSADLEARVEDGRFRSDLFYRINVFRLRLPSLAERPDDIPDLVTYFARKHGKAMGKPVKGVSEALIREFSARAWPGNVRELENAVRRALAVNQGEVLSFEGGLREGSALEDPCLLPCCAARSLDELLRAGDPSPFHTFVAEAEKAVIEEALRRVDGNLSAAARTLGMSRYTLRKKAQEYGTRLAASGNGVARTRPVAADPDPTG